MSFRAIAKTCFARAYTWADPIRRVAGSRAAGAPLILGYHRVVEDFQQSARHAIPSLLISVRMLERHLDWLGRRFELMSLDDIGAALESGRPFHRRPAAITFDDGYADVYRLAYPLLQRKGVPAAVFVVSDLIGTGRAQLWDRLYAACASLAQKRELARRILEACHTLGLDRLQPDRAPLAAQDDPYAVTRTLLGRFPAGDLVRLGEALEAEASMPEEVREELAPLDWDMIRALVNGGITIGSHTRSHVWLTREPAERVRDELRGSKAVLEQHLKRPVVHLAYPDGRFNASVVRAARASGYRFAYGICRRRDHRDPLLTIPRRVLWEHASVNALGRFSPAVMHCQIHWAFERPGVCGHDDHDEWPSGLPESAVRATAWSPGGRHF